VHFPNKAVANNVYVSAPKDCGDAFGAVNPKTAVTTCRSHAFKVAFPSSAACNSKYEKRYAIACLSDIYPLNNKASELDKRGEKVDSRQFLAVHTFQQFKRFVLLPSFYLVTLWHICAPSADGLLQWCYPETQPQS
jgi:hypothetical protein